MDVRLQGLRRVELESELLDDRGNDNGKEDGMPSEQKNFIVLPYTRGASDRLRRVLKRYGIKVAFRAENTLKRIFGLPKDTVPSSQITDCVYHIPCLTCDASYVGQTKRRFETRIREHQAAVRNMDANASALADHFIQTGHLMNWDEGKVIENEPRLFKRLFLEAWNTRTRNATLNGDTFKIPETYNCLIK